MFWSELRRWRGVLLIGVIAIGSLWLSLTGQLVLYIHPRYLVFTVVMSFIALAFVIARVVIAGRADAHDGHDHENGDSHDHDDDDPSDDTALQRVLSIAALTLSIALAAGAILLPPATLSAATASQRDITAANVNAGGTSVADASSASASTFAHYTVVEWSSLLAQTSDPSFYRGKIASVIGFVTPDPDDPANVFYVSRFVITCCAVDAQPIGVPVYAPDWKQTLKADDWVSVTGQFTADQSASSSATIALVPTEVKRVHEPDEPYLY